MEASLSGRLENRKKTKNTAEEALFMFSGRLDSPGWGGGRGGLAGMFSVGFLLKVARIEVLGRN